MTQTKYTDGNGVSEIWTNTKNYVSAQLLGYIPKSGTNALSGSIVPDTNNAYDLGNSAYNFKNVYACKLILKNSYIVRTANDDYLGLCGGTDYSNGAYFTLYGKDSTIISGAFRLRANDGTNSKDLIGEPDGTLTWGSKNVAMQEDVIPRSGGAVITGTEFFKTSNGSSLKLCAGSAWNNGGGVALWGKDSSSLPGGVTLKASNGTNYTSFDINPRGGVTLNNNGTTKNIAMYEDVVPRSGGAVMRGISYRRTVDNSALGFFGGTDYGHGAYLQINGKDYSDSGHFLLTANDGTQSKGFRGRPDGTLTWSGQPIQYGSDQRLKQQISEIDDKLLDAWKDVDLVQFKYNDAVEQKGNTARLHTGYVVQQIDEACKSHNVDISEYGLYCHEEYEEETREVEQADGTKKTEVVKPASEHYSLRYTEALIVECAFLRKKNKELQEQLDKLSARLDKLESASSK